MPLEAILNSPFIYPALAIVGLVFGVIISSKFLDKFDEEMEKEALEEVVQGEVKELIQEFGHESKKNVTYGLNKWGRIQKAYVEKEEVEIENDEGETETQEKEYFYFKVQPRGFFARVMASIIDDNAGFERYTKYVRIREDFIEDNEEVVIQGDWKPMKMANVWLSSGEEGAKFVQEKTFKAMYEETLETSKESIRAIQNLNLQFVQNMLEMEKAKELDGGDLEEQMKKFMSGR